MKKDYMIKAFAVLIIGGGVFSAPAQAGLFSSLSQKFQELSACTMDGAKAAFYDRKKFPAYAKKCINDKNMAKKNPNATTKFAGLCRDTKNKSTVEKNKGLNDACQIVIALVDGHELKKSAFSSLTQAAHQATHSLVKQGKKAVNSKIKEATGGFSLDCTVEKARLAFENPQQKLLKYTKACIDDKNAAIKNVNASRKFLSYCKKEGVSEADSTHPEILKVACKKLEAIEDKLVDNLLSTGSKIAKHVKKEVVSHNAKPKPKAKAKAVVAHEEHAVEHVEQAPAEHQEQAVEQVEQTTEHVEQAPAEHQEQAVEHVEQAIEHVEQATEQVEQTPEHTEQTEEHVEQAAEHVEQAVEPVEVSE